MICRFCRKGIRKSNPAIAPYIHEAGSLYSCPSHPETLAEPADQRWEKVWANIGPVPISGSDLETGFYKTLEKLVEIRIAVPYGVTVYTSTHRASKEQLEEFRGDLLSLILDRMVADIDDMINRSTNA